MRWGRLAVLYLVLALLAAEYWYVERARAPEAEEAPPRARFLALEPAAVREVRLLRDGRLVVGRRLGEGWEVVEPRDASIPSGLIAAFTSALASAEEIAHVAGADADRAAFGLTAGAVRVELVPETGEAVVVRMGQTNPAGTAIYAQRVGAADVILIGRQVRYYEDLIFQALAADRVPAADEAAPVG
jgi:hypothetical protein